MIKYLRKIIKNLFMDPLIPILHDIIIRASASTYSFLQLENLGFKMDLNLSNQKVRYIGDPTNHVYPEIVIWKPDYQGANTGQAEIVEAIEIRETINTSIDKWRRLSSMGITFNLVVPSDQLQQVRQILNVQNIIPTHLQTYDFIPAENRYVFTTVSQNG